MNLSRLFAPIALVSAIALSGISGSALADTTLRIGVTPVPHADIVNFIKPTLEKEGVKLEVVEFNDYIQPNLALDAGELDANYFQTIPYLEEMVKSRGLNLHILVSRASRADGPLLQEGEETRRHSGRRQGGRAVRPDERGSCTQGARARGPHQAQKDGATLLSGIGDIVSNPKKLKFVELEPALLPRALDDVTAAVINANYALEAGFNPAKNAIALEEKSSPFGNVVAIREGDDKKEAFQKLKKAITSPEVKKFIEEKYQGGVLPVF